VQVSEGLAAVRALERGELRLWGGAPSLEVGLERTEEGGADWRLVLENCLPDAELWLEPDILVAREVTGLPTRCEWQLSLPNEDRVVARIGSPRADEVGPFRVAILSDVQSALPEVGDIYARMNQEEDLAFVLSTGDLTEQGSKDQLEEFQVRLRGLGVPFFTTLGNHELFTSGPPFHDYFGRGSFHFEFRGVHFTLLDSGSSTLDPMVYDWLDDWLPRGRGSLHLVGTHIPVIDPVGLRNGSFASRNEAALLLGKLADADVDLLFFGHIHSYYRYELAGIEAHISGGGGAIPEQFDGIGRHYLRVNLDPDADAFTTQAVRVD
jgi:3',5'-cyclic AMP phosphodiesterase CpdA